MSTGPTQSAAWLALSSHRREVGPTHLRDLFEGHPERARGMTVDAGGMVFDFSKHRATATTLGLLGDLARERGLPARIQALFAGHPVNFTEQRAALHSALRADATPPGFPSRATAPDQVVWPGLMERVAAVRRRMGATATTVRSGRWMGSTGRPIRAVVNLGIGGSHLGPAMAARALAGGDGPATGDIGGGLEVRFVSNVDSGALADALVGLEAATTLFIICSKTFTTVETLTNAETARVWVEAGVGATAATGAAGAAPELGRHFLAVTSAPQRAVAFGVEPASVFEMWDWVGGRYSLASAVGLALMMAIGPVAFDQLRGGMAAMDRHFATAPLEANAPALMGLLGIWYRNFFGAGTQAVIPYASRLDLLADYLQQLEMESNGKSVDADGAPVGPTTGVETVPVIWGSPGTDGQHAYFQMLHQGTSMVPVDFIGFARPPRPPASIGLPADRLGRHHDLLVANLLAQSQALAFGRTAAEVAGSGVAAELVPHRRFEGNRPSTTILAPELSPATLGALIAAYEHKVFTQGVIWGINSFDQWGVELGKAMADRLVDQVAGRGAGDTTIAPHDRLDSSTAALLARYRTWNAENWS
ncbi:MAG: glucose-6-phosphate isomerase [Acidimicrobiales bacterium]